MREDLEEKIRAALRQRKRELRLAEKDRVSTAYVDEDAAKVPFLNSLMAGDDVTEFGRTLAERYGRPELTEIVGRTGTTKTPAVIADPGFEDAAGKFWVKYADSSTLTELWKNVTFSRFLNANGELGWGAARDWAPDTLETPFYTVMLKGETLLSKLPSNPNLMWPAIDFLGDYFFGKDAQARHWAKDKANEAIKAQIDLMALKMRRTALLGDQEQWNAKVNELVNAAKSFIPDKELWYCWIVTDCAPEQILYINGNGKKDSSQNFLWIDQGDRREILDAWLEKRGKVQRQQADYYEAFLGAPYDNLGQFWVSTEFPNNIPPTTKDLLRQTLIDFLYQGRFGREETALGERTKFREWDASTARLAAALFNMGQLKKIVYLHSTGTYGQYAEHFLQEGTELIKNTLSGNPYFFTSPPQVKTLNA